jgi:hypothetical protein
MRRTCVNPSPFTNFEESHNKTLRDLEQKAFAYMRRREQDAEKIDKENQVRC